MRIGQGYDIHKLVSGRPLIIGGVNIPFDKGMLGHSDADVLVHAIIDSILGASNQKDIGTHFPDTDPKYKGINSLELLYETGNLLKKEGYEIVNIDTTVVCEKPKLLNYKEEMKNNISNVLKINKEQISIKAKTKEGMDSTGLGSAIEAYSICLIKKI